jgi:hypothetical protein
MIEKLNKFLIENKYQSIYKPSNDVVFYDSLEVKYFAVIDGQNTFWPIEIGDLPFGDESMKGFNILQFYTPIVEDITESNYASICDLITRINPKITFGCFGYLASHKLVFFKHNIIFSELNFEENCKIVDKTMMIIFFMLENFQKALADVALGKLSVADAMETMPLNYIYQ